MDATCAIKESHTSRGLRTVTIENKWMAVTVLADKGADIYQLVYKPHNLDVLWKSPWGLKEPGSIAFSAPDPLTAWMDYYPGGWQEMFPNGGASCTYKGGQLPFHGEVAGLPWDYEIVENSQGQVAVRYAVRTLRTPYRLERVMSLQAEGPVLAIRERLTNEGAEEMEFMWGHHPAYGAPFLSEHCLLDIPAKHYEADDGYDPSNNPIRPGSLWQWPNVQSKEGQTLDLAHPLPEGAGVTMLGYFTDLAEGWYAITNTRLGLGIGLVWPLEILPYVWYYQEYDGALGYPFFGRCYVLAVEPVSSYPGQGLEVVLRKGTACRLAPGESLKLEMRVVFFESTTGVQRIAPDGQVGVRK